MTTTPTCGNDGSSGGTNVVAPWQEIRDRRYHGSCRQVRTYVARFRGNAAVPAPPPAPPKAQTVTGWIMTRPGEPAGADRASLNAILAASAELAAVAASVRALAAIMNERRGQFGSQKLASNADIRSRCRPDDRRS